MPITHFPLPQKETLDPKIPLIRYMPIWKFADLIAGRAWFPSIQQFCSPDNDLLEASPTNPFVYSAALTLSDLDVKRLLSEAIRYASEEDRRYLELSKAENIDCTELCYRLFHEYIYQARAAWCWYGTERESALMWKVFAKNGIAIQMTLDDLKKCLPSDRNFEVGAIRYHSIYQARLNSYRPERDSVALARPYFLKCDGFTDEQEIRVVTECSMGAKGLPLPLTNVENLIQKIIISPYVEGGLRGHECKRAEVQMIWNRRFGSNGTAPIVPSLLNKDWLEHENLKEKLRERLKIAPQNPQ